MENVIEKMEEKFGVVVFNGNKYVLIQDAHLDGSVGNPAYFADAIKASDEPDEDGYVQIYEVEWKIIYPEEDDEGNRCDWEKPVDVDATGAKFNLRDGSVF